MVRLVLRRLGAILALVGKDRNGHKTLATIATGRSPKTVIFSNDDLNQTVVVQNAQKNYKKQK